MATSRTGPLRIDLEQPASVDALFEDVPAPDAVVCCAASGPPVSPPPSEPRSIRRCVTSRCH
ncbi:hypothetical protein ACIQU6_22620 [Streptomyces sp. NPDC090442]|uniref:hypothetical protein n=1 Tax=Streptomyces sp. NPDC090442 TaxID=3365962 RepID=UPI003802738F